MRIIKPGVIPKPDIYDFNCKNCGCIFICSEFECVEHEDADGIYFSRYMTHECPTCHKTCYSKQY